MDLRKVAVSEPCREDWDAMQGDAQRRFCKACNKHVHNLSAMTEESAEAVCASGEVCVRYEVVGGRITHLPAIAALGLALSTPALASAEPQPEDLPWWTRAANAVYDWWWGPTPVPLPPLEHAPLDTGVVLPPRQWEGVTRREVVMGVPARDPLDKKPPVPTGTVSITLEPGSAAFTSIEVNCESTGFRQRAPFVNGTASLPGVPVEDCRLSFKGGPFVTMPIQGGVSLTCLAIDQRVTCR